MFYAIKKIEKVLEFKCVLEQNQSNNSNHVITNLCKIKIENTILTSQDTVTWSRLRGGLRVETTWWLAVTVVGRACAPPTLHPLTSPPRVPTLPFHLNENPIL